ncbi:hypothetical protein BYT27DRAFT_7203706 [Phlegmacium glaucopus]|nr:hypothetical protein BYT27DRAFT_7203706 [Phlegmacium glaucopus]
MFYEKVNFTIPALTACFILYTRVCAGVVYFTTGAVLCSISVKLVKRIIRQPRPPNLPGRKSKVSYGMPSTHSATISYYAAYIFLGCLYLPVHPTLPSGLAIRILPPLIILPCAISVIMSRVWLGHHTMPQVVAGISYGVAYASVWFVLWTRGLNSWGMYAEQLLHHWINATLH